MMLFVYQPKILHKYCLQFLLAVEMAQEKLKTMLMQNVVVISNKEHYVFNLHKHCFQIL